MSPGLLLRALIGFVRGQRDDAAALAVASLGASAYPGSARRLREMPEPFPSIDLDRLRRCPDGSFGQTYAVFMDMQKRRPAQLSSPLKRELMQRHRLAVRTWLLLDAVRVLLGFDETPAGTLGVLAFIAAQRDGSVTERAARWGHWLCRLIASEQPSRLRRREHHGQRLAERARSLILEPLEDRWHEPLGPLRASLGLPQIQGRRGTAPGAICGSSADGSKIGQ